MTDNLDVVATNDFMCKGVEIGGKYIYEGKVEVSVVIQSLRGGFTHVLCPCSMGGKCNNPNNQYDLRRECFCYRGQSQ